jgi:hypothetical protein
MRCSVVLSSVPITLGEETYDLLFTDRDMYDIEVAFQRDGIPPFVELMKVPPGQSLSRLNVLTTVMMYGLKVPGKFGPNGEPIRAIPSTRAGQDQVLAIIRAEVKDKPLDYTSVILVYPVVKSLALGKWYNIAQMLELAEEKAHASVPEGDSTLKNSEADGSNTLSQ